jgi:hypothetical protein
MPEIFERIGEPVAFGEPLISDEHAQTFQQIALMGTKIKKLELDTRTEIWTSSYARGMLSDAMGDYEVAESGFYGYTIRENDPHFWRSVVTFARFNQKNADTKIYNRYIVESVHGEVSHAVREVRVLRNLSHIAIGEDAEPYMEVLSRQRKMFEKAMTDEDVDNVAVMADRVVRRQAATRRYI